MTSYRPGDAHGAALDEGDVFATGGGGERRSQLGPSVDQAGTLIRDEDAFQASNSKGTVRFSGGLGRPVDIDERRDFTLKASRRPAPAPPSHSDIISHAPPTASSAPSPVKSLSRSNSTPVKPTSHHRQTSSLSSISSSSSGSGVVHPQIPSPAYPVRSQFGLNRSQSLRDKDEARMSPTISGGLTRRMSFSESENEEEDDTEVQMGREGRERERKRRMERSESLPIFPPPEILEMRADKKKEEALKDLPSNPKQWLPSHLSLYLTHTALSLHPLLAEDITSFIRTSRISGRVFLRLKDQDLEEMGVNILWRAPLSMAREQLRKEALGGKIWGFEGVRYGDGEGWEEETKPTDSGDGRLAVPLFYATDGDDEEQGEWKKSWRLTKGAKTAGRVKGIAKAFEAPEIPKSTSSTSLHSTSANGQGNGGRNRTSLVFPNSPIRHTRNDSINSTTSTASIDSGDAPPSANLPKVGVSRHSSSDSIASGDLSPFDYTPEPPIPKEYQANVASHSKDTVGPYQLVRRPSVQQRASPRRGSNGGVAERINTTMVRGPGSRMSVRELKFASVGDGSFSNEEGLSVSPEGYVEGEGDRTIKSSSMSKGSTTPSTTRSAKSILSSSSRGNVEVRQKSSLEEIFGIDTKRSEEEMQKIVDDDSGVGDSGDGEDSDWMSMQLGGRKGSMVMVRKSQLNELQRKLDDVEAKLAAALSTQSSTSPSTELVPTIPTNLGSWILSSFAKNTGSSLEGAKNRIEEMNDNPMSWSALGGYICCASIGIGIVAGEVVVSKLFGVGRR
ncbi:hypothetical protein T439DRAFT_243765 [Meredithblackwellia eburnea MCA 4105]